jgi:hypothetical protein
VDLRRRVREREGTGGLVVDKEGEKDYVTARLVGELCVWDRRTR